METISKDKNYWFVFDESVEIQKMNEWVKCKYDCEF